ncbi:MAG: hypothetical protein IKT67_12230 [Lachnospiraceae bacterium]|nr:hypothetical protein [Lachnospiraceae bacterium]
MGAVFVKILNMSLTAGWIVLAVLLVRLLFKKKAPKALFPILWALVAVRLVCPVTFESSFSLIRNPEPLEQTELPEDFFSQVELPEENSLQENPSQEKDAPGAFEEKTPVSAGRNPSIDAGDLMLEENMNISPDKTDESLSGSENEPVAGGPVPVIIPNELPEGVEFVEFETPGEQTTTSDKEEDAGTVEKTPVSVTYTEVGANGSNFTIKRTDWFAIAAIVWLVGIGIMLLYTAVSYISVYRRVKESAPLKDKVRVCDRIDSPFILGMLRPRIYLPSDISITDREYVISHEKAHLKRLDHIWKPLGFLLLSVYWFHPLLLVAYILLCKDIEFACDEKVIKELGAEQKKTYSTALINCSVSRKMISACPLAFGENGVKGRVKSVLHYKKPAFWVLVASVLVCVVMAVCFLTNPKSKEETPEITPTPIPTSSPVVTEPPEVSPAPTEADIPLDEKHFTSVKFREYLSAECDIDKNGYLSEEERADVRYLYLKAPVVPYYMKSDGFDVLDGFEYFPNLRYVYTNNAKQMIFNNHPSIRYVEVNGDLAYLHVEDCPKFQVISSKRGVIGSFYISDVAEDCIYQGEYLNGREEKHIIPLNSRCSIRLEYKEEFQEIRSTKTDSSGYYKEIPVEWLKRTENGVGINKEPFETYFVGKDVDFLQARIYDKERDSEYVFLTEEEENSTATFLWIYDGVILAEDDEIELDQYLYVQVPDLPKGLSEDDLYLRTGQNYQVVSVTAWADKGLKIGGSVNFDILYRENGEERTLTTIDDFWFYVYIDKNNNGRLFYWASELYDMIKQAPDPNGIEQPEVFFSSKALQNYLNKNYNSDGEEGLSESERKNVYYLNYLNSVSLYKERMDGLDHLPNLTDLYISSADSLVIDGHPSLEYIAGDATDLKKVIIKNCPKLKVIDLDLSVVEEVVIEGCYNLKNEYNKNRGELVTAIETTNLSIAIGDEYAAYLDEDGKLHVLYDVSYVTESDTVGATRGIDTSKTYKALGTDPYRLVAIDEEGRLSVSYYETAAEMQAILEEILKEVAEAGGNYGLGKPDPAIAKDFETISEVKQIFSTYPYDRYTALLEDGTVLYLGEKEELTGVVEITAKTNGVIAGLKEDGTLVMTEVSDVLRKKKLDTWPEKLKQIAAGYNFFVGLKLDGTVISEGVEQEYLINTIEQWSGIVKIAVGNETVVGLRGDGTVVAVCPGRSDVGQCDVDDWTNVIAINTNGSVTVGITKNGKVLMAGAVPEIVKELPERYNYEEIKTVFLEYLNHQAWLYPSQYPQEGYTCSYELYSSAKDVNTKDVYLKTVIKDTEYWVEFKPEKYYVATSPTRIVAQRTDIMRERLENGEIVSIGSDKVYVPATKKPAYGNPVDLTNEISSIYSDLKRNGYRDHLKIEVIVSEHDLEKNLYPYAYLIINDSEVFETSFGELEGNLHSFSQMFFYSNYTKDYTIEYGDGWPDVFDGHGIKPLDSVDPEQFERVMACAAIHQIYKGNSTETFLIDGQPIEIGSPNLGINEAIGVRIAFLPQEAAAGSVYYNIYRSDDSGQSWRLVAEDFSVAEGGIARILIPEKDTVVCWFEISGTTSQSSCFVSEDGGITWKHAPYASKPNSFTYDPQKDRSIIFGAYEQDGDYSNGKEPLEWLVLDRDSDRALLLSKYGIETLLWDKDKTLESWEVDDLYRMMNRTIYEAAFSAEERAALIKTNPMKNESVAYPNERLLYPGYTFLLETDDVLYGKSQDDTPYFRTEEARITIPTAFAAQKGAWLDKNIKFTDVAVPWIVTVTGTTDGDFSEVQFARVMPDGSISFEEEAIKEQHVLIRPAVWVDVTKLPKPDWMN